jgi:hypothetical protein
MKRFVILASHRASIELSHRKRSHHWLALLSNEKIIIHDNQERGAGNRCTATVCIHGSHQESALYKVCAFPESSRERRNVVQERDRDLDKQTPDYMLCTQMRVTIHPRVCAQTHSHAPVRVRARVRKSLHYTESIYIYIYIYIWNI